jgi:hypothetical protein
MTRIAVAAGANAGPAITVTPRPQGRGVVSSGGRPAHRGRQMAYFLTLTTTVLAWTSWKPWRLGLLAAE